MLLSLAVRDLEGKLLMEENSKILLPPASNMKVPTTYFAFKNLKTKGKLSTYIGIRDDQLYIWGDPLFMFSESDLLNLINEYMPKLRGVSFQVDEAYEEKYHPDWEIGDLQYCYGSPVEAYTIDENCSGGAHRGEKPDENLLEKKLGLKQVRGIPENRDFTNTFVVERDLSEIIKHTMHVSCNFSAELLLRYTSRSIAAGIKWLDAANSLGKFIESMGLNNDNFEIRDGSGLSRKNLFNTQGLSYLIHKIYKENPEYLKLMPSPGEGTLKDRLHEIRAFNIHAKTGTLSYISSLSGISLENGIIFSLIAYGKEKTEDREHEIDRRLERIISSS